MKSITGYTDGSCPVNPGPGGWAYVILLGVPSDATVHTDATVIEESGYVRDATNNTMELFAAIELMRQAVAQNWHTRHRLIIWSDSKYVVYGMENYRHSWADYDFKGIKNPELWKFAHKVAEKFPKGHLRFEWLRGHVGHYWNERCDAMAGAAVKRGNRNHINRRD